MKLTSVVFRLSNYLNFHNVPGNIVVGKHRIWPKLSAKHKRHLLRQIDTEINNMKFISAPYITEEQSRRYNESVKEEQQIQRLNETIEKQRANKNKIRDQLMSEHLDGLRNHAVWE